MTVRLLAEYGDAPVGAVLALGAATEAALIAQGQAVNTSDPANWPPLVTPQYRELQPDELAATRALLSGAGIDVSFARDFDGASLGYTLDAGSGQVLPVMRVTVEAATTVIAGARISSGGINTFETTITGAATQGEVIPISVGAARITRVHVGLSTGTAQTLSADATVVTNELASWSCLEADDCNVIFVRFGPPRSSGRLCDVTIVGKARA